MICVDAPSQESASRLGVLPPSAVEASCFAGLTNLLLVNLHLVQQNLVHHPCTRSLATPGAGAVAKAEAPGVVASSSRSGTWPAADWSFR